MDQVLRELDESRGTPGEGEGAPAPVNASDDPPGTQDPDFAKSFFEFINRELQTLCLVPACRSAVLGAGIRRHGQGDQG